MSKELRKLNFLLKKALMTQELESTDLSHSGYMNTTEHKRQRAYKGSQNFGKKSEYEKQGQKFGIRVCKSSRKGLYNL